MFFEVIIGDDFDKDALSILKRKKNVRLIDSKNNKSHVNFFINSPGGSVSYGLAILDAMQYISPRTEVHTICNGTASGLSALILASGTKGLRFSYPHSKISLSEISYPEKKEIIQPQENWICFKV